MGLRAWGAGDVGFDVVWVGGLGGSCAAAVSSAFGSLRVWGVGDCLGSVGFRMPPKGSK